MLVFKIIKRRKFIYYTTWILRKIVVFIFFSALICMGVVIIAKNLIPSIIDDLHIYIGFSAVFLWIFFNMITSYYEIGELSLSNEGINLSLDETEMLKVSELEGIKIYIHDYEGQSYGPRSLSVFQGNKNYIVINKGESVIKYSFLVKSKNAIAKLSLVVNYWKQNGANAKLYYRGYEVENYDFL